MPDKESRKVGWGRTAQKSGGGRWLWEIDDWTFAYEGKFGLNFTAVHKWTGSEARLHMPCIRVAGYFAEGLAVGSLMGDGAEQANA